MKLWRSWVVAMKDFSVFRRTKYALFLMVAMPIIIGIMVPMIFSLLLPNSVLLDILTGHVPSIPLASWINSEFLIFITIAAVLPATIASYSFIGEKVEKSLEPLLATPTTDSELLLGKSVAAFLPSMAATYEGATIFLIFVNSLTYGQLGYLLFPSWTAVVVLGLTSPLACITSIEANIIISSRFNDIKTAQSLGGGVIFPFLMIFIIGQAYPQIFDAYFLFLMSGVLLVVDTVLYYISRAIFQREEILTKWK